jgi:hypothetical protein
MNRGAAATKEILTSTTMFFCFSGTSQFTEEKAHKLVINSEHGLNQIQGAN